MCHTMCEDFHRYAEQIVTQFSPHGAESANNGAERVKLLSRTTVTALS